MRLQLYRTLLLISIFSTTRRAAVSCDGLLSESSFSLLAAPIARRDKPAPSPSPASTPTPALASKQDPPVQAKKSKNSSVDTTISEDTSTPTLNTIESTTISPTSTIIVSPTPASSNSASSAYTSLITTSSALSASTTTSPAPLSTQIATSTTSKSSVSSGLIAGVVIAILLVLAALTWVISMRQHLRQREWQFKYHERIFDGPEGLLNKKQQAQQQQKEGHEMTCPNSIVGKGSVTVVMEKQLPAHPDVDVSEPEKVLYGRQVKRKPVGDVKHEIK